MPSNYPDSLDSFTAKVDGVDTVAASHVNDLQDAIVQIETELGTNPASGFTSVAASLAARLRTTGDTMLGNLDMNWNRVRNLGEPMEDLDAATRGFVMNNISPTGIRWRDDFLGSPSSRWTVSGSGGSCTPNSEVGGTADLATGASVNNAAWLSFGGKGCTSTVHGPFLKVRARLGSTTQVKAVLAGLYTDSDNLIEILYDASSLAGNFKYRCVSVGTETLVDSDLPADSLYHIFCMALDALSGQVTFSIDNGHVQTLSSNVPSSVLELRLGLETKEASDKRLTVDLVHFESGR